MRNAWTHRLAAGAIAALTGLTLGAAGAAAADTPLSLLINRSVDGRANNLQHPTWGQAGQPYRRVAPANYVDGKSQQVTPVKADRYVSNRIFNDVNQNVFSENGVSQWGFVWGQFMDHTFGLRGQEGAVPAPLPFPGFPADPLESFSSDAPIDFSRSQAVDGTGVHNARQQLNTVSSYIDGSSVYGDSASRLDWLRDGSVDGNPANNSARLLLPNGYLPRRDARGNAATAPPTDLIGRLAGFPDEAVVAGDVRANENIALTGTHTLFAREHNRIVAALPAILPNELKFQIARRVVGAEQQFITYDEFLPALGVNLAPYRGYKPNVDATLTNEFATVGYRAHSMIHGEFETDAEADEYTPAQIDALRAAHVEVEQVGDELEFTTPLNIAFGNPNLVKMIGLGPVMFGLSSESEYKNDEQIDNQLRSVLFQVPKPGAPNPLDCLDGPPLPTCFNLVQDLGALDIARGRDHGMPSYNDLRRAYGLAAKSSFKAITGEATEAFPSDPLINAAHPIDDPNILDVTQLFDREGNELAIGSEAGDATAVREVRRTTVAARLKAIYGSVSKLDAFTGMLSERHVAGAEMGELQRAIWKREFESLRDGDRFFYLNDPAIPAIQALFGISSRRTLAQIIRANTDAEDVPDNVFKLAPA